MSSQAPLRFAQLRVSLLLDDDMPELSDAAMRLFTLGIIKTAGTDPAGGTIDVSVGKRVQRWAHLDGGVGAVTAAVRELVDAGWLEPVEGGLHRWSSWSDVYGTEVRTSASADGKRGAHKRWHVDRGVVADDCAECQANPPAPLPEPENAPEPVAEPENVEQPALLHVPAKRTATDVRRELVEQIIPALLEREDTTHTAYREALEMADVLADENPDASPKIRSFLKNAVIGHAAEAVHGIPGKDVPRLVDGAEAISKRDGLDWVLLALVQTAGCAIDGDPVRYVLGTASSLRAERGGTTS